MEVFCTVRDSKDNGALVDIVHVIGTGRGIAGAHDGLIHVSMIDNRFISHPKDEFRIGDIVRAKVVQSYPSPRLATDDPRYGVVRALCTECRSLLERKGGELWCPSCEREQHRKIADDYGRVAKW
jgi:exosome complex component CSL4